MTIEIPEDFVDPSRWQAYASGRAQLRLQCDTGHDASALRLDFDFHGGGGFVVARRPARLTLPPAYCLRLAVRGEMPSNRFELKLVDPGGTNVWRYQQETLEPDGDWHDIEIPSRLIDFAWGPAGGGVAREIGAIEIAIVAGSGGRGHLCIADLRMEDRTPPWPPGLKASAALPGHPPTAVLDTGSATDWRAGRGCGEAWLTLDFRRECEYGGLILNWTEPADGSPGDGAPDSACERAFRVLASKDEEDWRLLYTAERAGGACSFVGLLNGSSRYLRLALDPGPDGVYPALGSIELQPDAFSRSPNELFHHVAERAPRGRYPRWLYREQTYWTAVDVPDGGIPALLNEDGSVEVGPAAGRGAGWTLEPFLFIDDRLLGWAELAPVPALEQGELPIPSVTGAGPGLVLATTAYASGALGQRVLYARYRLENRRDTPLEATLFVAVRPFQVSPPWQGYADIGGVSPIHRLAYRDGRVRVNEDEVVIPLSAPSGFGAATFDQGAITDRLAVGRLPTDQAADDPLGFASGALRFDRVLSHGGVEEVVIAIPFARDGAGSDAEALRLGHGLDADAGFAEAVREWSHRLGAVAFDLPPSARILAATAKTALAHILINRDGPAFQPGPRRYTRSWIRDGAVMSAAVLRMGCRTESADFIRWYAGIQTEAGEVPCCVDHTGPDWLPEHDSLGEFIFAVAEPVRFTGDRQLAADLWPAVCRAVAYLEQLRAGRLTDAERTPERRACFGLLPESVSHEGYLAQPVHAYWDDLWAVRGLKDAAWLAEVLGEDAEHARLTALCEDFRGTLYASIERTMSEHGIDFIPGSVEWADPDPTAIAVALTLIDEGHHLPEAALQRTFEELLKRFRAMHDQCVDWTNYSPYEVRVVGALVRLGRRREAHEVLRVLLADLRPPAWHQWPEIIWRDPRAPGHQGDLPHAWISAEYVLVFRDLFAYEREADRSLVVCAGIPREWLDEGPVSVTGLPTWYGRLDLHLGRGAGDAFELSLSGLDRIPPGGIRFAPPLDLASRSVRVNGGEAADEVTATELVIRALPARVVVT
ncbi:discoidin domain-containing protein [Thiocapsa bogorovii]|uniref:discoidin domain-containing protein n=1 Tax=Thiocapsa bogorovii TaxID=521689 RepID=UPI001E40B01D|nr:discoidin domain-containing protein [Thiocapsa bogorovii]UHD14757.1 hypothetical protein LT988_15865 [Thiocapsa bogorovii]